MTRKSRFWWDWSVRDFAEADMGAMVAIQPVGAVESHGPHLPVRVDAAINAGVVARALDHLPDDVPALVLPMMPVGKSNEHNAFPGTLTFTYETLARMWIELGESVLRAGCRRILYLNSHGGQPQVMEIVCRELRVRHGMFAVGASWFRMTKKDDLFSAAELKHGIHGGEVETSVMLHLHPELVAMEHAADFAPLSIELERSGGILVPEGGVGFGWQTQDLHPSGACGNAAAADGARGAEVVDRAGRSLARLIAEIAAYPLDRITQRTLYDRI
ncbi:creatininase family protein [Prosthecomicrobium sp. N25]|uniref:creatininase family protein n=1 Tax=Prosthecomicrobium sp. N25 TaxID=3129254 RepID=UPI003076BFCA